MQLVNILVIRKPTQLQCAAQEMISPPISIRIRWILVGTDDQLQTEMKSKLVDRSAFKITQNIMHAFKTTRQMQHIPKKASDTLRTPHSRENPQVLGLSLAVHHDTSNKC